MKKSLGFVAALTAAVSLLALSGQALAYEVSGDVLIPGVYASADTLWNVLSSAIIKVNATQGNPSGTENWIEEDYVQVTGASGSKALYSVGELNPAYGATAVSLTPNGTGGYNLSGAGQTVANVTNISVVHAVDPVKGGPWTYSNSFTVSNGSTLLDTFSLSGTNLADTAGKIPTSTTFYGGSNHPYNYTGVSLLSVLQSLGINTSNLNQYIKVTATDNYATVLSMGELVNGEKAFLAYKGDPNDSGTSVGPLVTVSGQVVAGYDGFARLMLPDESNPGLWVSRIASIEVDGAPVPVPATLLLCAPGLAGLAAIRRRSKK